MRSLDSVFSPPCGLVQFGDDDLDFMLPDFGGPRRPGTTGPRTATATATAAARKANTGAAARLTAADFGFSDTDSASQSGSFRRTASHDSMPMSPVWVASAKRHSVKPNRAAAPALESAPRPSLLNSLDWTPSPTIPLATPTDSSHGGGSPPTHTGGGDSQRRGTQPAAPSLTSDARIGATHAAAAAASDTRVRSGVASDREDGSVSTSGTDGFSDSDRGGVVGVVTDEVVEAAHTAPARRDDPFVAGGISMVQAVAGSFSSSHTSMSDRESGSDGESACGSKRGGGATHGEGDSPPEDRGTSGQDVQGNLRGQHGQVGDVSIAEGESSNRVSTQSPRPYPRQEPSDVDTQGAGVGDGVGDGGADGAGFGEPRSLLVVLPQHDAVARVQQSIPRTHSLESEDSEIVGITQQPSPLPASERRLVATPRQASFGNECSPTQTTSHAQVGGFDPHNGVDYCLQHCTGPRCVVDATTGLVLSGAQLRAAVSAVAAELSYVKSQPAAAVVVHCALCIVHCALCILHVHLCWCRPMVVVSSPLHVMVSTCWHSGCLACNTVTWLSCHLVRTSW